jgi:hypothetical protein
LVRCGLAAAQQTISADSRAIEGALRALYFIWLLLNGKRYPRGEAKGGFLLSAPGFVTRCKDC